MARLPIPGDDVGNWGTILNDYLSQSHNEDGSIKTTSLAGYVDPQISQLSSRITTLQSTGVTPLAHTHTESDLSLSNNTTANVSITKHGLMPMLPGGTSTFLRGDGTYTVPPSITGSTNPGWVNVMALGATGDGTTDDTAAIQSGIASGAHLYFPIGTYIVVDLNIVNKNNVVLFGYGATLKLKTGTALWHQIIRVNTVTNLKIIGLKFDGNKEGVAGSATAGCFSVDLKIASNFLFKDCKMCNSYYGITQLSNCHYGDFIDCIFDDLDVGVMGINAANTHINIHNCQFLNGTSEAICFAAMVVADQSAFDAWGYHENIIITNCKIMNKNGNTMQFRNVKKLLVSDNYIERTDTSKSMGGISLDSDAITTATIVPQNIIIKGNVIKGNKYEGVLLNCSNAIDVIVENNIFDNVYSYNILTNCACTIKNNTFRNINASIQQLIWVQGNNAKILFNYFDVVDVVIPFSIVVSSSKTGVKIIKNIINKNSGNTSLDLKLIAGTGGSYYMVDNYGFTNNILTLNSGETLTTS